jgi:DNA processing protein
MERRGGGKADDRRRLAGCRNRLNLKDGESKGPQSSLAAGGSSRTVLQHLKPDAPVTLDYLVETLQGTSPSEIIAALFELELAGLVRQLPGKSFIKVWAD